MTNKNIWIIEDDTSIRWVLKKALDKLEAKIITFDSAESALSQTISDPPSVVITDIRMAGKSGLDFLKEFKASQPTTPVIVMTAFSDLATTVEAFKLGAFDYLTKPFEINDAQQMVKKALAHSEQQNPKPKNTEQPNENSIIGESVEIQKVFTAIGRLSQSDINVLITGESGTGKELVATALYENSPRSEHPLITINTAAIPLELLESELFGHEKGAFTGATTRRIGRFEQAHQGTLFLDEIGDMPLALQTRLLRVLQDGQYYRVGGHQLIQSDVRVIAATNQNLAELVKQGKFREDLYHRLNVVQIELPPLKNRAEDIPLLINHFLGQSAVKFNTQPKVLTQDAMLALSQYQWPGNIRELENVCRGLMVMTPAKTIDIQDLPDHLQPIIDPVSTETEAQNWQSLLANSVRQQLINQGENLTAQYSRELETILLTETLKYTNHHKINTAKILGISRNTITRKINELDLES